MELSARLEAAGLLERTRRLGNVAHIEDVYARADIVVLPSYAEGLPLTLLEAMAMGCLVTASRVGEIPSMGITADLLFAPGDREGCRAALSAAIARLPAPADALRTRVAREHGLASVAARYEALYREIG